MSCITVKEEDYIFDASAKKITLKNLEIEQKFIRGIYNLNTANNEAIYTGIGGKGGVVVFTGGHTELTLSHDTTLMADTDQLRIDIALDAFEFIFKHTPVDAAIPFGALPTINPVLNTEPNLIDTGWVYVDDYFKGGQLLYSLINDVGASGKAYLMNASDATGSQIFGSTNPIPLSGFIPLLAGFEFPNKYFRAVLVNDGTVDWTNYVVKSTARQSPPNGFYQSIGQPIPNGTPATFIQTAIVAQDDVTNDWVSPNTHKDSEGTSLVVAAGHEPSEVFNRSKIQLTETASGVVTPITLTPYTPTAGKFGRIKHMVITVTNLISTGGVVEIKDGTTVVENYSLAPGTNQFKVGLALSNNYNESLDIYDSLVIEVPATGIGSSISVNIKGYEKSL